MRLTQVLFGVFKKKGIRGQPFRFTKHTPGKIDIGKHRIVPDVKTGHKLKMWERLAIEEENILYISNPYLTKEEDRHVPREIVQLGCRKFEAHQRPPFKRRPLRSVYFGEILDGLNATRQWENY
ncbi:ribosomal protein 63, mitochondrial [Galendromus occidentalis]|uniref:Ribosomal protein 63, mitochondrial n=1 Tax=Galendromus occidentalis TaxID=34638 RepID=A0AAJ6QUS0_9ACAR|nr:ribosomal protein 63, mitochondrial [Galendromus occidentalis]